MRQQLWPFKRRKVCTKDRLIGKGSVCNTQFQSGLLAIRRRVQETYAVSDGSGTNSAASFTESFMRPACQSAFACSILLRDERTKLRSMRRSPSGSPPSSITTARLMAPITIGRPRLKISILLASNVLPCTSSNPVAIYTRRARSIASRAARVHSGQAANARKTSARVFEPQSWYQKAARDQARPKATRRKRRQVARCVMFERTFALLKLLRQTNPDPDAVQGAALSACVLKSLRVLDAATGGHPIDCSRSDRLPGAKTVAMDDFAIEQLRDS